jgi:hypothetical protein
MNDKEWKKTRRSKNELNYLHHLYIMPGPNLSILTNSNHTGRTQNVTYNAKWFLSHYKYTKVL